MRMILAVASVLMLCGCCGSQTAIDLQISQDEAKLTRMYLECVEKNLGNGDVIKKNCEPILAPYANH